MSKWWCKCILIIWMEQQQQPFYEPLSGTTQVSWYQKKHSPTHTYPDHQPYFISFLNLLWSIASSPFNICGWQSTCTTSLQVLFHLPLGIPHIFSPNHCLLFATHAHTIALCLVGWQEGHLACKNVSGGMLAWLSVWGEVQICIWPRWCYCHSISLAPVNPDWFYHSGTGSPR